MTFSEPSLKARWKALKSLGFTNWCFRVDHSISGQQTDTLFERRCSVAVYYWLGSALTRQENLLRHGRMTVLDILFLIKSLLIMFFVLLQRRAAEGFYQTKLCHSSYYACLVAGNSCVKLGECCGVQAGLLTLSDWEECSPLLISVSSYCGCHLCFPKLQRQRVLDNLLAC